MRKCDSGEFYIFCFMVRTPQYHTYTHTGSVRGIRQINPPLRGLTAFGGRPSCTAPSRDVVTSSFRAICDVDQPTRDQRRRVVRLAVVLIV